MQRRSLRLVLAGAFAILASACGDALGPSGASSSFTPEVAKPEMTGFTITLGLGCDPNATTACTPLAESDTLMVPDTTATQPAPQP